MNGSMKYVIVMRQCHGLNWLQVSEAKQTIFTNIFACNVANYPSCYAKNDFTGSFIRYGVSWLPTIDFFEGRCVP